MLNFSKKSIKIFVIIFFPAVLIAIVTKIILYSFDFYSFTLFNQNKTLDSSAVTLAPIIETYLLMKIIDIYQTERSENQKCLIIGVFWGVLHGIFSFASLFSATWGFFWLSKIFIQTTNEFSKKIAFIQNVILHTAHNFFIILCFDPSIIFG